MKNKLILSMAVFAFIFTGCKDKKDKISPSINNPSTSVDAFLVKNGAQKQDFTINVDNSVVTITGEKGTKVSFPEDAFVNMENQPVSGAIEIQLIEIYDQASMVLSNKPTKQWSIIDFRRRNIS